MTGRSGWHRKRTTPAVLARQAKYRSPEHLAAKTAIAALVAQGQAHCWRCKTKLRPNLGGRINWHVGHNDQGDQIMGGECTPCNLKAAASKGARIANANRKARQQPPPDPNAHKPFQRPQR